MRINRLATMLALSALLAFAATPPADAHRGRRHHRHRGAAALEEGLDLSGRGVLSTGRICVSSHDGHERFKVEVEHADEATPLNLFIDDGTGAFVTVGPLVAEADDGEDGGADRELVLDTGRGDALPAGAATVAALEGRAVEVRTDAGVLLAGTVPALDTRHGDDADENDGDDNDNDDGDENDQGQADQPALGRSALMRDVASPFPDASGEVEARKSPTGDSLEIEAKHLDAAAALEFFLEQDDGTLVSIGTATADSQGEAKLAFDTAQGDTLPLGAASVDALAGRRVEVRTAAGIPVLFGIVPNATTSAENHHEKGSFDLSGNSARVDAKVNGRAGRERLTIKVRDRAAAGGTAELFVDDGTGTLVLAGSATVRRSGTVRFTFDNRKGGTLPLSAERLHDLSGRAFEIRVGGAVAVSGTLPAI